VKYCAHACLGARYLQFQPLMSEGAALREGYQLSADNWGRFMEVKIHLMLV
jgi:hypothetical protein